MKLKVINLLFFIITFSTLGQRNLFNQRYENMASDFNLDDTELDDYKSQGKIVVFNEEKHKTKLAKKLLNLKTGKSKKEDKRFYEIVYQIIGKEDITHYRVRYIFVDKTKFENEEKLEQYLKKVRMLLEETEFKSVAMQYSMDYLKNVGGDSSWFKESKTQPEFFREVTNTNRLSDEIFEFEIPDNNGYYFVKKTHAKMDINEVLVLEMKEKK